MRNGGSQVVGMVRRLVGRDAPEAKDSRVLRFRVSDRTVDSYGDVIIPRGWRLTRWRRNPVMLWNHGRNSDVPPIATAVADDLTDERLQIDFAFPPPEIYPFADLIYRLYRGVQHPQHGRLRFLRGVSVGFRPLKSRSPTEEEVKAWRMPPNGKVYERQELLEVSAVPLPANPSALIVGEVRDALAALESAGAVTRDDFDLAVAVGLLAEDQLPRRATVAVPAGEEDTSKQDTSEKDTSEREAVSREGSDHAVVGGASSSPAPDEQEGDDEGMAHSASAACTPTLGDAEEFDALCALVRQRPPTTIQSLVFDKRVFPTAASARRWAEEHGFHGKPPEETANTWRIRIRPPEDFVEGSFRMITLTRGVRAVIGRLKPGRREMELADRLEALTGHLAGLVESLREGMESLREATLAVERAADATLAVQHGAIERHRPRRKAEHWTSIILGAEGNDDD